MTVSLWKLGGLTPYRLLVNVGKQMGEDAIADRAAALSYYFLLALFPLLLFLMTLLGFLAGPGSQVRNTLMSDLARLMPASASELVSKTISEVSKAASGWKLV